MNKENDYPYPKRKDLRKKGKKKLDAKNVVSDVVIKSDVVNPYPSRLKVHKKDTPVDISKKKKNKKIKIFLWIFISLLLSISIFFGFFIYFKNQEVEVPKAEGVVSEGTRSVDVCSEFTDLGLNCEKVGEYSKLDKGSIISQSLPVGSIANKGDVITIYYSLGSKFVKLPNLSGMNVDDAVAELSEIGLEYGGSVEVDSSDVSKGVIVDTTIPAGSKLLNGTKVYINVSNGSFSMPNWVGLTRDAVENDADRLNLNVEYKEEESDKPTGVILSQEPKAGTVYNNDSKVTVTVAKTKDSKNIVIPDVVGLTEEEAQIKLAMAGLKYIKVVNEDESKTVVNSIIETIPKAGEKINSEDTVTLVKKKK